VAHMGEKRNANSILVGKPERNYLENLDEDRMMIFNCFYINRVGEFGLVRLAECYNRWTGVCKRGKEPSGFISCGELRDCWRNYQLMKSSAPRSNFGTL
jgi:hypothetical protein